MSQSFCEQQKRINTIDRVFGSLALLCTSIYGSIVLFERLFGCETCWNDTNFLLLVAVAVMVWIISAFIVIGLYLTLLKIVTCILQWNQKSEVKD